MSDSQIYCGSDQQSMTVVDQSFRSVLAETSKTSNHTKYSVNVPNNIKRCITIFTQGVVAS
jgi:hypothetical protein